MASFVQLFSTAHDVESYIFGTLCNSDVLPLLLLCIEVAECLPFEDFNE